MLIPNDNLSHGRDQEAMFFFWGDVETTNYSYGHLPVITGDFDGIIHSINGVISTYNL